jgi:hypothetical protein
MTAYRHGIDFYVTRMAELPFVATVSFDINLDSNVEDVKHLFA